LKFSVEAHKGVAVATDLTIYLDDEPGALARLGEILGAGGVNIEGFCAVKTGGGQAEIHVLVEDAEPAFAALDRAAISVELEQEVVVIAVEDRPGVLGDVTRKLGDTGVNISLSYLATDTRLVIAADDLATVRAVLP
jgi:hypothetical protein